jgi:hypothetical protein
VFFFATGAWGVAAEPRSNSTLALLFHLGKANKMEHARATFSILRQRRPAETTVDYSTRTLKALPPLVSLETNPYHIAGFAIVVLLFENNVSQILKHFPSENV